MAELLKEYLHRAEEIPEELVLATCERSRRQPAAGDGDRPHSHRAGRGGHQAPSTWVIDQGCAWRPERHPRRRGGDCRDAPGVCCLRTNVRMLDYAAIIGETFWRDAVLSLVRAQAPWPTGKMPREFLPGHDPYSRAAEDTLRSLVKKELHHQEAAQLLRRPPPSSASPIASPVAWRMPGWRRTRCGVATDRWPSGWSWPWARSGRGTWSCWPSTWSGAAIGRGLPGPTCTLPTPLGARFANDTAIMLYERALSCFDPGRPGADHGGAAQPRLGLPPGGGLRLRADALPADAALGVAAWFPAPKGAWPTTRWAAPTGRRETTAGPSRRCSVA